MSVGLTRVSGETLRDLAVALERDRLACPVGLTGLRAAGFGEHAADLSAALGGLDRRGALAVVRVALAEREQRARTALELVWTGPLIPQAAHRDTGVVMRQLFARAQREVLIGGFRFDAGADLFEPLHVAMRDRGVAVDVFLDIEGHAPSAAGGEAHAKARIAEFYAHNWPFEGPKPTVFYDPRTAVPGPPWVSLHAKCVVVDARWTLVTSANFTDRAQTRNIELGVLIEDGAFARTVVTQWRALVSARRVSIAG